MQTTIVSMFLLLAALAGCQSATVERSVVAQHPGSDPDDQLSFWHGLADQPIASNDDAFHALLLMTDGHDPAEDYAGRVDRLRQRDMLPAGFDEPADHAVTRGTLAVALVRILDIRGGLTMSLLGPSPRYATRELIVAGIYPRSSPNQTFSGADLLGVIARVEEHQEAWAARPQAEAAQEGEQEPAPDVDQEAEQGVEAR